jgi:hypothetical protein
MARRLPPPTHAAQGSGVRVAGRVVTSTGHAPRTSLPTSLNAASMDTVYAFLCSPGARARTAAALAQDQQAGHSGRPAIIRASNRAVRGNTREEP